MSRPSSINVYEHERLIVGDHLKFTQKVLSKLETYYGTKGVPYFSLIHRGVKFNNYVGLIQIGGTTINVLPKIDKSNHDENTWQRVLIDMLRYTNGIKVSSTSTSNLKLKSNSILDLYIELFIKECDKLTHHGLVKNYRKGTENQNALKGRLHIPGQIRDNLIHKERFNVEYNIYDENHLINQILKKTLLTLSKIPIRIDLQTKVKSLLLYFENISDCMVYESLFERINLSRNSARYAEALGIAKLILLNYHPDISRGDNHVLAIMFDMNVLWEKFITKMMKKHLSNQYEVRAKNTKVFWDPGTKEKTLQPDILLISKMDSSNKIIIDTKWKNPSNFNPSDEDLRQVFAYNLVFEANHAVLLYPGNTQYKHGVFKVRNAGIGSLLSVDILDKSKKLVTSDLLFRNLQLQVRNNDNTVINR